MAHPIARAGSGPQYPVVSIGSGCDDKDAFVTVEDPLFRVTQYTVTASDGSLAVAGVPEPDGDGGASFSFPVDRSPITDEPGYRSYEVTVTNSLGEINSATLDAERCAIAVVVAMGLNSGLESSVPTVSDVNPDCEQPGSRRPLQQVGRD